MVDECNLMRLSYRVEVVLEAVYRASSGLPLTVFSVAGVSGEDSFRIITLRPLRV